MKTSIRKRLDRIEDHLGWALAIGFGNIVVLITFILLLIITGVLK